MDRRRFLLSLATAPLVLAAKPADLALTTLDGAKARLRDYRGKIVVVNFWATWCGPCKEEMPLIVAAEKEHRGRVVFIAASLDDSKTRPRIPEFLRRYQVEFPVFTGATGDDLARLDMGEAVPATAFLDEAGRIVARVSGEIRKSELDERLAWLLGDRSAPAPKPFVRHLGGGQPVTDGLDSRSGSIQILELRD